VFLKRSVSWRSKVAGTMVPPVDRNRRAGEQRLHPYSQQRRPADPRSGSSALQSQHGLSSSPIAPGIQPLAQRRAGIGALQRAVNALGQDPANTHDWPLQGSHAGLIAGLQQAGQPQPQERAADALWMTQPLSGQTSSRLEGPRELFPKLFEQAESVEVDAPPQSSQGRRGDAFAGGMLAVPERDLIGVPTAPMEQLGSQANTQQSKVGSPASEADSLTMLPAHPMNPKLSTDYDNRHEIAIDEAPLDMLSKFLGYKIMHPEMEEAVKQMSTDPGMLTTMANEDPTVVERCRTYHDDGPNRPLRPGVLGLGGPTSVEIPPDIDLPSARVYLHTHENIGGHDPARPSVVRDVQNAREFQNVQHGILVPPLQPGGVPRPIVFTGANPPRHYFGLENPDPDRFQATPHSPDLSPEPDGTPRFPAFKEKPEGWDEAVELSRHRK
jgi:hypothetical protein